MIIVQDGNVRKLIFNDTIIEGGSNRKGLYALDNQLFFDGKVISTSSENNNGLVFNYDKLYFNGVEIKNEDIPTYNFWNAPTQEASVLKPWSYEELISEYDSLMNEFPNYISKETYSGKTLNGDYDLHHYVLEPDNYSKTIFIQAGIHGNEMDSKQQLLRFVKTLLYKTDLEGYTELKVLRNDVRFILIPCVSPYGHDNSSMNVPYDGAQYGINLNRNYDYNHQYALSGTGVGGNLPFEYAEVRHTDYVLSKYGIDNIDFGQDWHDGGGVLEHYWINYNVDAPNREDTINLINTLINKYNIENPITPNCKDTGTTGTTQGYMSKTLGMVSSTVEWIGGLLGYDFKESHMTQSFELRVNSVLLAYYLKNDVKFPKVEQGYFKWEFPKAFTRNGLRDERPAAETKVSDAQIYARWNALQVENSSYITKTVVGTDVTATQEVATYTLGSGTNKVLYIGGIMRYQAPHKIDEYAIYQIAEYLCNPLYVSKSPILQDLKNNYTIIVLPCIDNTASNTVEYRTAGLNNQALSYKKWQIVNDKTVPTANSLTYNDVPIIKTLIDNNQDLKCIVSGGEIMTGYSGNTQDYPTDYETQFVIPRKMTIDNLNDYISYLENDKNENVDVSNTIGFTFGDYAFDQYGIPTYFIQQKVSKRFEELSDFHTLTEQQYLHQNYEAGRRMSTIINTILCNTN